MKRLRQTLKKFIPAVLATTLLVGDTLSPLSTGTLEVYADNVSDTGENTSGDGKGGYSGEGTDSTWFKIEQSGYRFYIVDGNFNLMSSILDITYKEPWADVSAEHMYFSTATQKLNKSNAHTIKTWEKINSLVPSVSDHIPLGPLVKGESKDKVYVEKGEDFKQWVINGIGGNSISYTMGEMSKDTSNSNSNKVTSSIGGSGGGSYSGGSGSSGSSSSKVAEINAMNKDEVKNYINDRIMNSSPEALLKSPSAEMKAAAEKLAEANSGAVKSGMQALNMVLSMNTMSLLNGGMTAEQIRNAVYKELRNKGISPSIALAVTIDIYPSNTTVKPGNMLSYNDTSDETEILAEAESNQYSQYSLDQIIATGNSEGYLIDILNAKMSDGSRLIYYTYEGANNNQLVTKTMASKGWYLIVEPVFWTHYTTVNNGKDDFYTYGSYRDLVNYYSQKGYSGYGPNNKQLMNRYGWRSMTIGTTVGFGSTTFSPPSYKQEADCASISDLANTATSMGYAMHIYSAEGSAYTKTRSEIFCPICPAFSSNTIQLLHLSNSNKIIVKFIPQSL